MRVLFPGTQAISRTRRGAAVVTLALSLIFLLAFAALAVDVGLMYTVKADLQKAADAAALAGAQGLPDRDDAVEFANEFSDRNIPYVGAPSTQPAVALGRWDSDLETFTVDALSANAVEVTLTHRVNNLFGRALGVEATSIRATAIAVAPPRVAFRFLIDDEMIDTDIPAIEALAARRRTTTDNLLRDGNGDRFLDFPPGETLTLPTGQVGDEALFDTGSQFPYTDSSVPSLASFLRNELPQWRLDPLVGVDPFNDVAGYGQLVDPDVIHVSPVWKSDVSNTTPWVNAQGERRGLLAFKIIGVGPDPAGSPLPFLTIQIIAPSEVGDLGDVVLRGGSAKLQIVR
jgi:Flp pilus assembly protein TadG